MVTIVGDVTGPSAALALPPIKYTSPCREDQRLSTEGKIVSKYCNTSKSLEGEGSIHPFPLYNGVGMNLPVRRVERIGRCIECRFYRCNLWLTNSTHLRATCNFPTHGLKITDYARAKLKNHDFFGTFPYQRLHYEYINIRGISCENCTAATKQGNFSSATTSMALLV